MFICTAFYLLYVKLEEQYGLARHAMSIYERATSALPNGEKLEVLSFFMNSLLKSGHLISSSPVILNSNEAHHKIKVVRGRLKFISLLI